MEKPAILVVDDDAEVLRALARDVRQKYGPDYRVLRAESGAAALEVLSELDRRGEPLALVLTDQRMPQLDGVTLLARVREMFPRAQRVLITAYADTEAAIAAINLSQVDYYLVKPWHPPDERLYPVLDDLLEDWRSGWKPGYAGIRIVGDRWSARTHELKEFLSRYQVPYEFLDVETSATARELAARAAPAAGDNGGNPPLPLVILPGAPALVAPRPSDLAAHLGLQTQPAAAFYDLAIVGAGPAGLAAAVYGASEGLRTVLIERDAPGGQAGTSSRIENYLGFPSGLTGSDLSRRAVTQARRFGVEILAPQAVSALRVDGPYRRLELADGTAVACHALMLTMGLAWQRLPAAGAEELTGRGVFYGATLSEAVGCRGEDVYVIGAGNSAGQAALHFARYADRVVMLVRGDSLEARMSRYLVDRIRESPTIEVRLGREVSACHGTEHLEGISVVERGTGQVEELKARYVFVFIGAVPCTPWLRGAVALDDNGYVLAGPDLRPDDLRGWPFERAPYLLEASVPGVFAAGDVRHQSIKRVASAVGEGSVAVHFIHRYLASL